MKKLKIFFKEKVKASHCLAVVFVSVILGAIFIYLCWPVALFFGVTILISAVLADRKMPIKELKSSKEDG